MDLLACCVVLFGWLFVDRAASANPRLVGASGTLGSMGSWGTNVQSSPVDRVWVVYESAQDSLFCDPNAEASPFGWPSPASSARSAEALSACWRGMSVLEDGNVLFVGHTNHAGSLEEAEVLARDMNGWLEWLSAPGCESAAESRCKWSESERKVMARASPFLEVVANRLLRSSLRRVPPLRPCPTSDLSYRVSPLLQRWRLDRAHGVPSFYFTVLKEA